MECKDLYRKEKVDTRDGMMQNVIVGLIRILIQRIVEYRADRKKIK